jgi:hypothetical protein
VIVLRPSSLRSSSTMGLGVSKEGPCQEPERPESVISSKLHGRQASIRQSTIRAKSKQPMPDPNELERRFTKVLVRPDSAFDTDHVLRPRFISVCVVRILFSYQNNAGMSHAPTTRSSAFCRPAAENANRLTSHC